MNCQRVRVLLSAYLDEMLPARDAGSVAGHLARCAGCRKELQALESAVGLLDRVRPSTPPIDLWERFQARLAEQTASAPHPRPVRGEPTASGVPIRRWLPALAASRVVLAPLAAAVVLVVGIAGYRLGLQGSPSSPGVLAGALVTRSTSQPERSEEPQESTTRLPVRRTPITSAIVPPEETMAPWAHWGPRDAETVTSASTRGSRGEVPVLPQASAGDASGRQMVSDATAPEPERTETTPSPVSPPFLPRPGAEAATRPGRVEATASAHLAGALQASIEEVARRQVTDEVALLAQALKRSESRPTGDRQPTLPGEVR